MRDEGLYTLTGSARQPVTGASDDVTAIATLSDGLGHKIRLEQRLSNSGTQLARIVRSFGVAGWRCSY